MHDHVVGVQCLCAVLPLALRLIVLSAICTMEHLHEIISAWLSADSLTGPYTGLIDVPPQASSCIRIFARRIPLAASSLSAIGELFVGITPAYPTQSQQQLYCIRLHDDRSFPVSGSNLLKLDCQRWLGSL